MSSQTQLGTGNKVSLEPLKIQCSPWSRGLLRAQAIALNFCCAMSCLFHHMIWSNHFPPFTSPHSFRFFFPASPTLPPSHCLQHKFTQFICCCCLTGSTSKASPPLPLPPEKELILAMVRAGWPEQPKGIHLPTRCAREEYVHIICWSSWEHPATIHTAPPGRV